MKEKKTIEFWNSMQKYFYKENSLLKAKKEVESLVSLLNIKSSKKILDVPCGNGRIAIELAKKGHSVFACDISEEILNIGKSKANELNLKINWINQNFLFLNMPNQFDFIINIDYSFGFFKEKENNIKVLDNFFSCLCHGGTIILQLLGRDIIQKYFYPKYWNENEDNSFMLTERKIDYDSGWIIDNFLLIKDGFVKSYELGMQTYYPYEIYDDLKSCGFSEIYFYGDLNKKEYDETSQGLFVIAQKPLRNMFPKC